MILLLELAPLWDFFTCLAFDLVTSGAVKTTLTSVACLLCAVPSLCGPRAPPRSGSPVPWPLLMTSATCLLAFKGRVSPPPSPWGEGGVLRQEMASALLEESSVCSTYASSLCNSIKGVKLCFQIVRPHLMCVRCLAQDACELVPIKGSPEPGKTRAPWSPGLGTSQGIVRAWSPLYFTEFSAISL